jgi:hypothetical protein
MLGSFVKVSEIKKKVAKYTCNARICIYMNVETTLMESIYISFQGE